MDLKKYTLSDLNRDILAKSDAGGKKLSRSRLWYAAAIPLITLFIEVYANSFALGVLVWSCCVLSWTIACLLDRRYLMKNEVDVSELSPFTAVLPPLYIFKRVTITGDQNTAAIVFICFAFYAACANGFSQGIMMDEDKMVSQVKDNYWSNISNVATIDGAKDSGTIGGTIDDAPASLGADGKAKWTAKRDGNVIHVTVTRGDLALRFEETFDGFTFTDIKVTYYSDGTQKAKYDKDGDNTVFKKYIEGLLKKQSGKD